MASKTISIATQGPRRSIDAHTVTGFLAIHRPTMWRGGETIVQRTGWVITHVPTGLRVMSGIDKIDMARDLLWRLQPEHERWDFASPGGGVAWIGEINQLKQDMETAQRAGKRTG